jgi:hypothetical protein
MANLTKAQLVLAAQQNVGRSTELDAICDLRLNLIINELYENYTWPNMLKINSSITLSQSLNTWTVPTDYIKAEVLTFVDNNKTFELPMIPYADLQLRGIAETSEGTPKYVSILRTIGDTGAITLTGYVWPKPNKAYTATLSYYRFPLFDAGDADTPMVFDMMSLLNLLTNELRGMGYNRPGAAPYDQFLIDKIVGKMRRNLADQGIYPTRARLDSRTFYRQVRQSWPEDTGG